MVTESSSVDMPPGSESGFRRTSEESTLTDGSRSIDLSRYPGRLIAIEGTDGVGRSTHIALLREWLETRGFGVAYTAQTKSRLAGEGLRRAKEGHTLGRITMDLFYATDFADRLENQILPALRAGFVVLSDRYIYSTMARSMVRGGDPEWVQDLYRFAPKPHAVFYLKIDVPRLTPRVLARGGFDYWESGMDFQEENDLYHSWVRYQTRLISVFDDLSRQHGFDVIDGNREVTPVFTDLARRVFGVVSGMDGAKR